MEEEPNHENLKGSHADNETALDQAEVDNPLLGASDSAEVTVLARPEVLLVSRHGRKLTRDLDYGLLEGCGLFGRGSLLGGQVDSSFVLDLNGYLLACAMRFGTVRPVSCDTYSDFEIDKLVGDSAHLVVEAERVVTDVVASEDKVSLALLLAIRNDLARGPGDLEIDIK